MEEGPSTAEPADVHQRGNFHGCYLLVSRCPEARFKNRAYIGYTVDPNRRIKQHNGGKGKGGAKKTSDKGPWDMTLIVHGFPSEVAGLRFEWAWQNPAKSRRLKPFRLAKLPRKESQWEFRFRVLCRMLETAPWAQLRLTLQWLLPAYRRPLPDSLRGRVAEREGLVRLEGSGAPSSASPDLSEALLPDCRLCQGPVPEASLARCPDQACALPFHLTCLASALKDLPLNKATPLVPFHAKCPQCEVPFHWMDLVRRIRARKFL